MRYVHLLTLALLLGATTFVEAQQTNNNDVGSAVERAPLSLGSVLGASSTAGLEAEAVQGSLTGLLTDASSGRALGSAQVFISGTGLGSLSNAAGRYLILNVPVGQHTLEVMLIGYGAQQQQVTVSEGQVTTADYALTEEALALDANYARAWSGMASAYLSLWTALPGPLDEGVARARQAVERALELDEGLAEAHALLGQIRRTYDWDWAGAEASLQRALALEPNNVEVLLGTAQLATTLGRLD